MCYITKGGVRTNGPHYSIDINAMARRLSKRGSEYSVRDVSMLLQIELNRIGITWGVPLKGDNKVCIADYKFEDGVRLEQQLEDKFNNLPQIREWREGLYD